jgi:hypothetical protein
MVAILAGSAHHEPFCDQLGDPAAWA